ncbi:FG-GAP repeat domain-containing protein [Streptomyces sp. R44]|uniref:FG-GAP repeat domain-containing protein n=1 Tax=Streptomyces sp. R44 TaxID=3238633 RepID=A0AB39T3L1_9ACTN
MATVLALTGGALAAAPATAATTAGPAAPATGQQAALSFPARSEIVGAGATGFLSKGEKLLWTRFSDGSTTELPGTPIGEIRSDVVGVTTAPNVFRLYDMATGAEPVTIDLSGRGFTFEAAAVSGTTLAVWAGDQLHLVSKEGDRITDRPVPDVVAPWHTRKVVPTQSGEFAVSHPGDTGRPLSFVDIATGTVTQAFSDVPSPDFTATKSRLAWVDHMWNDSPDYALNLTVLDRATGARTVTPLGTGRQASVEALGDWFLTADRQGLTRAEHPDLVPLVAHHADGRTVRLLDHRSSSAVAPDGSLLARGGTKEHGEGLYRISPAADGTPTAEFLAGSGESVELGVPVATVPEAVTLSTWNKGILFSWGVSRTNVRCELTLRHTTTGKTVTDTFNGSWSNPPTTINHFMGGLYEERPIPSGAYTWELTATPLNGIGEAVRSSGAITVARVTAAHDYTGNGTPDVLARDAAGRLWRDDTTYPDNVLRSAGRSSLGGGWQAYDRIEAAGNLGGSDTDDLLARDRNGGLWLYQGKGDGGFTPRVKIGTNWQIYDKIAAGSDVSGDGRADVLATDRSGGLWLYPGTGNANTPLGARKKIGTSWGVYDLVVATGNSVGAPAGDVFARDRAGVLWMYLGKGDGTFAPRVKVGGGWNAYQHLVPVGNADRYGRPDLLAIGPTGAYLYRSIGTWNRPFSYRDRAALYAGETGAFNDYS